MRNDPEPPGDYVQRVNLAIDHILHNLDQPLSLAVVAHAAGFSEFHFHRVFKSLVGETLNEFIKRVRLERALRLLSFGPARSLTDVALECGFQSSSDFSRSFKKAYGVPPSKFDLESFRAERREQWQASTADASTRHLLDRLPPGENPDGFEVKLRRLPARDVVYIRVPDSYRPEAAPAATERLVSWAEERGLADGQWLGYMWDDPEIVPLEKCRYDVGLVIPEGVEVPRVGGEVGHLRFPPMLVAELEVRGPIDLEMRAIDWLYGTWLPRSEYVPAAQPGFECWLGRPYAQGFEHFEIAAHLPVERR